MPVHVRLEWPVGYVLSPETGHRLVAYLSRWAQTLPVSVREAGADSERVTLVIELPPALSLDAVTVPLREASARFARETLGVADFVWEREGVRADSIAVLEPSSGAGINRAEDETPAWLKDAMAQGKGTGK